MRHILDLAGIKSRAQCIRFADAEDAPSEDAPRFKKSLSMDVRNQPPMDREHWRYKVERMINAYEAPITEEDAAVIVDYLVRVKGKAG